jgi:protein-disulfide isomerase
MKKTPIIITVVIILFMGLGFLLYKISPPPVSALNLKEFDLSQVKDVSQPREVEADDHVMGNPGAKNTLIVYEDIQCPACKRFEPILKQLPSELTDTKLVFRHYPLYPTPHRNSLAAAYAAEAAAAQGKFWEFVSKMYEEQDAWANLPNPLDKMAEIAGSVGVSNLEQFKQNILNSKYSEKIQKDNFEALGLKVGSTPTLLLNGKQIELGDVESIKKQAQSLYIK